MNRSDVESFLGALEQLLGSYSDIGAHVEFLKPEFVMHELLQKKLWIIEH